MGELGTEWIATDEKHIDWGDVQRYEVFLTVYTMKKGENKWKRVTESTTALLKDYEVIRSQDEECYFWIKEAVLKCETITDFPLSPPDEFSELPVFIL